MDTTDARIHLRQTANGYLCTVRLITGGRVRWYRHNATMPGPLSELLAEALHRALRHHEIQGPVSAQEALPL